MGPEEKQAYVEGRLIGLNKLIKILVDLTNDPQIPKMIRTLVDNISSEVDNILLEIGKLPEIQPVKPKINHLEQPTVVPIEKPPVVPKPEKKIPIVEKLKQPPKPVPKPVAKPPEPKPSSKPEIRQEVKPAPKPAVDIKELLGQALQSSSKPAEKKETPITDETTPKKETIKKEKPKTDDILNELLSLEAK